ncbi:hypothetical protein [Denitromonas halophila]|uniref:Uncharacterized protein n=1 Tax=Denitromonas halophila TaxID=1629404 RepID=A0A557QM11_9RHOO|nr:hypothetical protein [Denitromonas halophila]TVO53946.1 hypothetical protein FHP91_14260 [Denitromonas halophila]
MHPVLATSALIAATLFAAAPPVLADQHAPAAVTPAQAPARWTSDTPLRAAIDEMAQMLRAVGHDLQQNQRTEAQYDALADWMLKRLATFPTTHADRNAAIALSEIKKDLGDGADIMTHATHLPARRLGYMMAVQALNRYGKSFEHPDWTPIPY